MKVRAIETLIKVPRLTAGRRLQALERMRAAMTTLDRPVPGLAEAMEDAEAVHREVTELLNEWRRTTTAPPSPVRSTCFGEKLGIS